MEHLRRDALLMEILQERKTITGFLDAIFGFLKRNTDFYYIRKDESEKIGFQKGLREQIVYATMQMYDPENAIYNLATDDNNECCDVPPPAIEEIEVESDTGQMKQIVKKSATRTGVVFSEADYTNGAIFENYCWSQTLKDVELHLKLPTELNRSKLITIDTKADSITVKSARDPNVILISGQICNKIKYTDVVWTIIEGKLIISFDKAKELWWDKLFISENAIDVKKIDCELFIDELPEGTQAAIQKVRVEQMEQDVLQQNNIDGMLDNTWKSENSPFNEQTFNSTVFNLS